MQRTFLFLISLLVAASGFAQFTPYGIGLVQQANDRAARLYLRSTNMEPGTNVIFSQGSYYGSLRINVPSGGGGGTVTSFSAGNFSPLFNTSVANPNTTPALSFAAINQSANLVFAGPASGAAAAPTFRAIVPADLPIALTNAGNATGSLINDSNSPVFKLKSLSAGANVSLTDQGTNIEVAATGTSVALTNAGDASGTLIYRSNAPTFQLKSITPGANIVITNQDTNLVIAALSTSVAVTNAGNSTGSLINDSNAPTFKFKSLSAGANVTITDQGTNLEVAASGTTVTITNAGIPSGTLIYRSNAPNFQLKSISAGTNVVIEDNDTNLVINAGSVVSTNFDLNAFDDNVYSWDEEFDFWRGTGSGQFTRLSGWAVVTVGGGGGIVNVSSNVPPYYGMIELQGSTTPSNAVYVGQYSSTGIDPYQNLANASNWLFHCIFFLHVTNTGSCYRIGLADGINTTVGGAMFPSNSIGVRWYQNLVDGNHFVFEARSNATSVSVQSSVIVAQDTPYKFSMWSTNAGIVWFSVNGESPRSLTNTPVQSVGALAYDAATNATASRLWLDRMAFRATGLGR